MSKEIEKILEDGERDEVRTLFSFNREDDTDLIRKKFLLWSRYLLPDFFKDKDAPFHKEMDTRIINVYKNGESFLNIAFRGAAKTNRAKLLTAFFIANDEEHHRRYIKVLSKELDNAKQIVTDVYNIFMRSEVGGFYPEVFQKTQAKREETMMSFTTATGIKMTADSVGTDQRGDIQEESRPDLILFEDFETRGSLASAVTTHKIGDNMEEARTGLAKNSGIIYNANYVSERGNVHKLVERIRNKIIIPIEEDGEPTWPERYTKEDIQKIKRDAEDYEGEYLCQPSASKDTYFDRESLNKQVPKKAIEEIAGLKIFKRYDPSHRIGSGHDVGGGVGLDSSTSVFIDFDTIPAQVAATYKNNEIKPEIFGYEIIRQGKRFGENYVGIEKNKYDSVVLIVKQNYPTDKIHQTRYTGDKILIRTPKEYGWDTNTLTKPKMFSEGAKAIEDGLVDLNDPDLINEAKSYTRDDLMDKDIDPRLTTRHFDLLTAFCIAWQMKDFVPAVKVKDRWETALERKYFQTQQKNKPNPAR